jgi:hypothetical protein
VPGAERVRTALESMIPLEALGRPANGSVFAVHFRTETPPICGGPTQTFQQCWASTPTIPMKIGIFSLPLYEYRTNEAIFARFRRCRRFWNQQVADPKTARFFVVRIHAGEPPPYWSSRTTAQVDASVSEPAMCPKHFAGTCPPGVSGSRSAPPGWLRLRLKVRAAGVPRSTS